MSDFDVDNLNNSINITRKLNNRKNINNMMTLNGGSYGLDTEIQNNESNFTTLPKLNMFKVDNLYPTFPKIKDPITGVILPAFDSTLSKEDTARAGSFESYRDMTMRDKSGRPALTSWFVPIGFRPEGSKFTKGGIYKYFGKSKSTFISPTTIGNPDPIVDLAIWIRVQKKKYGDTTWMHLVERKEYNSQDPMATEIQALPNPQMAIMMNVLSTGSNPHDENKDKLQNRILVITETSFNGLLEDINAYTPAGMTPIDVDFQRYMLGDITKPNAALKFTTEEKKDNITWVHLNFGAAKEDPMAGTITFYGSQMNVTQDQLTGRYDLTDTERVVNIPTYDEIVMQLLVEGLVPRDLMIAAGINKKCRHFPNEQEVQDYIDSWNKANPPQKKEAAVSVQQQTQAYNTPVGFGAPQQTAPAPTASPALQAPISYQQPVMQQAVQQPVMAQPIQQPVMQQPQYQQPDPTAIFTTASNASSRVPAPVPSQASVQPTPVTQPTAPSISQMLAGSLTPEELAEMQRLEQKSQTDPTSMTTEDFNKLASFISRKQH